MPKAIACRYIALFPCLHVDRCPCVREWNCTNASHTHVHRQHFELTPWDGAEITEHRRRRVMAIASMEIVTNKAKVRCQRVNFRSDCATSDCCWIIWDHIVRPTKDLCKRVSITWGWEWGYACGQMCARCSNGHESNSASGIWAYGRSCFRTQSQTCCHAM